MEENVLYDDDEFADDGRCPTCGDGEAFDLLESGCIDDLCHGGEVPCMHGDFTTIPCSACGK